MLQSSSPAQAGDPVIRGLSAKFDGLWLLDAPPSRGIETPKTEIELIKARLRIAQAHYAAWSTEGGQRQ
jgi:hypothetical protein